MHVTIKTIRTRTDVANMLHAYLEKEHRRQQQQKQQHVRKRKTGKGREMKGTAYGSDKSSFISAVMVGSCASDENASYLMSPGFPDPPSTAAAPSPPATWLFDGIFRSAAACSAMILFFLFCSTAKPHQLSTPSRAKKEFSFLQCCLCCLVQQ